MIDIKGFTEDTELHLKGSEVKIGDSFFTLSRNGTAEGSKVMHNIRQSIVGPFYRDDLITEDQHAECNAHYLVEYIVKDWRNLFDIDGVAVPFNRKNSSAVFVANKGNWLSLNQFVIAHSSSYINYLRKQKVEDIESIKKQ
jgi:hypothetical protein